MTAIGHLVGKRISYIIALNDPVNISLSD